MFSLSRVICVGTYVRDKLSIYLLHNGSSSCEGMNLCSFWRPISAMSLLKSPHSICMWFGCASICILMVCCMVGINLIFQYVKACINVLLAMIVMDDFLHV